MADMDIGKAVAHLWDGHKVARKGWNGPGQYLGLRRPGELSKMTGPYIFLRTAKGEYVPWAPTQADLLSGDWYVVE